MKFKKLLLFSLTAISLNIFAAPWYYSPSRKKLKDEPRSPSIHDLAKLDRHKSFEQKQWLKQISGLNNKSSLAKKLMARLKKKS